MTPDVVAALVVIGLLSVTVPPLIHRRITVDITGFDWERSIDVYTEQWVYRSSSWGPPRNARNVRSSTQTHRTTRAVTRYMFKTEYQGGKWQTRYVPETRWEPTTVTQTTYTYEVPKRTFSHRMKQTGTSRDNVRWPDVSGPTGNRRERYTVNLRTTGGRSLRWNTSERRWLAVDQDATLTARVTWYGVVLHVASR